MAALQPQRIDQRRQRGRLLLPARVIEEVPGERLAPIFQHADERTARQIIRNPVLTHESDADAVKGCADDEFDIVEDQRSVDGNGQGFPALFELPAIDVAAMSMPEIDASMCEQVARNFRLGMRLEV